MIGLVSEWCFFNMSLEKRVSTSPSLFLCTVDYRRGTYCYGIRCSKKKKKKNLRMHICNDTETKKKKNNNRPQNATLKKT